MYVYMYIKVNIKWSRYRLGVAQRMGRGIALLFHDRGSRRGWVVSSTPRPLFTPGKDPVPILQTAGWATGAVWTGAENLVPTGIRSRTVQPVALSLYRLSYPAQTCVYTNTHTHTHIYIYIYMNVKWSRYKPDVAKRVGRGIAVLFHDRGTRRVVSGQQHAPAAL